MGEREIQEIRIGVYATEEQARELVERFMLVLCPDPEHAGPCPVPWSIGLAPGEALTDDPYPGLVEQFRIEHGEG
ncbi:hypothetical protein ABZ816_03660 [Actinosynnema sp. NPDC047251]|uniref:Uncharacterized protein n=1 Tax=Saccharothrix espanaensis (strain ATCC 51144 / DSM 44229 / JCM 9112 / NBRC 15066 / NRRL 15764) TaxID=1179773 RepID=K0JU54_SACES|nr:hypothetical protein [Saccharothrix espanaensis]CCH31355.1 hypothetical protein BN6_40690 [Saccharothrix espanaensis DSM 44229]